MRVPGASRFAPVGTEPRDAGLPARAPAVPDRSPAGDLPRPLAAVIRAAVDRTAG